MKGYTQTRPQDFTITVFGAGVTGLTAAHELAERGFKVQVIDTDINEEVFPRTKDRGIGGMARSQFACDPDDKASPEAMLELEPASTYLVDDVLVFERAPGTVPHLTIGAGRPTEIVDRLRQLLTTKPELSVLVRLPAAENGDPSPKERMEALLKALGTGFEDRLLETPIRRPPGNSGFWAAFYVPGNYFPAEHGFRFFPAFYRHLFDTMRRTRIVNSLPFERGATVYDNLIPSRGLGLARAGKAQSFLVPRSKLKSFEELRRLLQLVLKELGYELADLELFQLKLFKYMTSCSARRKAEYENISWAQFMEIERYSAIVREHMEFGAQMSAALRGSQSDARTQGNITLQLLMDQLGPDGATDSKLNGPTSGAWFDHWHDYLQRQGVTFKRGKLLGFDGATGEVRPVLANGEMLESGYFVLALSLPAMAELAPLFLAAAHKANRDLPPDNDFERITAFAGDPAALKADLELPEPTGPLQHLSGIQYYFDSDLKLWAGHTQYLDAKWGLTSISQPQFWAKARDPQNAFRGLLSVDIGIWNRPFISAATGGPGKTAWQSTAKEIADLAWCQIADHHDDAIRFEYGPNAHVNKPIAWALDQNLVFKPGGVGIAHDKTPFLVNRTGAYTHRPGALVDNSDQNPEERPKSKLPSKYTVHLLKPYVDAANPGSGYVLAGTFMQTFTRLTSMEGANESARHAVNALLDISGTNADRCEIWDPEDHEISDLQWLKDLDQRLFRDGRPHFVDILDWRELPQTLPPQLSFLGLSISARVI